MGLVSRTISQAKKDLAYFFLILMSVAAGYSFLGCKLFGGENDEPAISADGRAPKWLERLIGHGLSLCVKLLWSFTDSLFQAPHVFQQSIWVTYITGATNIYRS